MDNNNSKNKESSNDELYHGYNVSMDKIIENGKKYGFYCVYVHSESYENNAQFIGPFDYDTAMFYHIKHYGSRENGADLYHMQGGSTFSTEMDTSETRSDIKEAHFVKLHKKDFVCGPFGTMGELYVYMSTQQKELQDKSQVKHMWFSIHNFKRSIDLEIHREKNEKKYAEKYAEEQLKNMNDANEIQKIMNQNAQSKRKRKTRK
jgi:hypothetical protein